VTLELPPEVLRVLQVARELFVRPMKAITSPAPVPFRSMMPARPSALVPPVTEPHYAITSTLVPEVVWRRK